MERFCLLSCGRYSVQHLPRRHLRYRASTAELSRDYDERSRLTAYRMGFSLAGSVGGLVAALLVFHS